MILMVVMVVATKGNPSSVLGNQFCVRMKSRVGKKIRGARSTINSNEQMFRLCYIP